MQYIQISLSATQKYNAVLVCPIIKMNALHLNLRTVASLIYGCDGLHMLLIRYILNPLFCKPFKYICMNTIGTGYRGSKVADGMRIHHGWYPLW